MRNIYLRKDLYPEYRNSDNLIIKKANYSSFKMGKGFEQTFHKG